MGTQSPPSRLSRLDLLKQGVDQDVKIPLRYMLSRVLISLEAASPPKFNCVKVDDSCYEATVKIDVSNTRATKEPNVKEKLLCGETCSTAEAAVDNACMKAFEYLDSIRLVCVKDHSTAVAKHFESWENWQSVNSVSHVVSKAIEEMEVYVRKLCNLANSLELKHLAEIRIGEGSEYGQIYGEMVNDFKPVMDKYKDQHNEVKMQYDKLEDLRCKYRDDSNAAVDEYSYKGYAQHGYVTEKDVLEYVLSYLELPDAKYENEYIEGTGFLGRVKIKLPHLKHAGCNGKTYFSGLRLLSAEDSEDYAAFRALRFLENTLNVHPIDLNYADQVKAKKNHQLLIDLLQSFQMLGPSIKTSWKHMNRVMSELCSFYASDYRYINEKKMSEVHLKTVEHWANAFQHLVTQSMEKYQEHVVKLKGLDKYYPRHIR